MKRLIPFLLLCVLLGEGCASARVTMFGNATYPSKDENTTIDVYRTSNPAQEYVEIAQITCKDTNDKWCLEQISEKAREIGADAIIIIGKAGSYGMGFPMGGYSTYVLNEEYDMV